MGKGVHPLDVKHVPNQGWCPATGKRRWRRRHLARQELAIARRFRLLGGLGWTVDTEYRCEWCKGWHLTSLSDHDSRVDAIAKRQGVSYEEAEERAVMLMTELLDLQDRGGYVLLQHPGPEGKRERLRIL